MQSTQIQIIKQSEPIFYSDDYESPSSTPDFNYLQQEEQQQASKSTRKRYISKKPKSIKMFRCTICDREYSNIGGIVTHHKNKHGGYNADYVQKTKHNKSKEHLGRPMQNKVRKIESSQKLIDFLSSVKSGYKDKKLEFNLDKNLKFVQCGLMEAGDPVTYQLKQNLLIVDYKDMEKDPWANMDKYNDINTDLQKRLPIPDHFLYQFYYEMEEQIEQNDKIIEFLQKILESIREDQKNFIIDIFNIIYNNIWCEYGDISKKVKLQLQQDKQKYSVLSYIQGDQLNQLINIICQGTVCYVKNIPNVCYKTYFGYEKE